MIIGVPTELKNHEYRVALVPGAVQMLTDAGHQVVIERDAGLGSGITNESFEAAGATIVDAVDEVWGRAEMIMKVKEPVAEEYDRIRPNQLLFTYFHLAAVPTLAPVLLEKKVSAVAYETIQLDSGLLPLLHPMSQVAGKMSVQAGARHLEKDVGGKGVLLGGIPGVRRARVVIIGGGTVGTAAAKIAVGMGASVTILDRSLERLDYLADIFGSRVNLVFSNPVTLDREIEQADLLVGAVLVPGARAPHLVSRRQVARLEPGSVIVDVAVDQGGCVETIRGTTHENPTYVEEGVVHYGVTNMPGAVAQTSTYGLTNATIPYAMKLAHFGLEEACKRDRALALGLNTYGGGVAYRSVAEALDLPYDPPSFVASAH